MIEKYYKNTRWEYVYTDDLRKYLKRKLKEAEEEEQKAREDLQADLKDVGHEYLDTTTIKLWGERIILLEEILEELK